MAKTRFIQSSFNSGVLSPLILGRIDLEQYYNGLEVGENILLLPQGGCKRRPGTKFTEAALPVMLKNETVPTMPNGGNAAFLNDDNDATFGTTTANVSTTDPYVVAVYDFTAAIDIEYVDLRAIELTVSGTSDEFVIQTSPDNTTWTTAVAVPLLGTELQDFRLRVSTVARYLRLARVGVTDLTTNKVRVGEFNASSKTAVLSEVKLKDFSISSEEHYLFVITDGNVRIYDSADDTYKADVKVSFLSSQVKDIRDVQSEKVIILLEKDNNPIRITNLGTGADWFKDNVPFTNIPQFDYNDALSPTAVSEIQDITFNTFVVGQKYQLDVAGVFSKDTTFAGVSTADERDSTAENLRKNLQSMPVFGEGGITVVFTSGSSFRITIADESAGDYELFAGFPTTGASTDNITFVKIATGTARTEDVFSATRGWPKTACFYEGRLVIGGTKSKPQSIITSKSGSAFNLNIEEGDDDDGIFTTISSRELSDIVDVFPGRNLQIFTAGSEFAVLISPITPQTFGVVPQTSHGSLNLEVKEIDGATLIIDRNGKTIREYLYSFNEDAYVANDISVLSPELINQPVDLTILGGTSSDDANWVMITNADGSATILNTLRSQDINGFTKWTTSGAITDASAVNENIYMNNLRNIDGVDANYIERWDFDSYVDSSITVAIDKFSYFVKGLEHLEGEVVRVRADGVDAGTFTVNNGQVTLGNLYTSAQVGIPFTPKLRSMPLSTNIGSGPNASRIKKILRINIRTADTAGIYIDGLPTPVREFGPTTDSPLDTPPNVTTGIISDVYAIGGWGRDVMPEFSQPDPMPFTILNVEYEVESS